MPDGAAPLIDVAGVGVVYRLASVKRPSLKEYAVTWAGGQLTHTTFWALKDVSFRVGRGEGLGIVGRNAAGKSTLLKLLAGVLEPSVGRIEVNGQVASLLNAGAAFDMELSGAENVYLAALLMGKSRREIDQAFDGIVAFSGLGDFVGSPIRNYSMGMVARLSFAVTVAFPVDILLIDEVLEVGDEAFKQRCTQKLRQMLATGIAVVVVSHDPAAIRRVCDRCLWIEDGVIKTDGRTEHVLADYLQHPAGPELHSVDDRQIS